uniref:Uncharacterized protein n=1 Tax=Anguilla anguilla TaxID=7936 RepID=A0A0E9RMJ0_ANGAN
MLGVPLFLQLALLPLLPTRTQALRMARRLSHTPGLTWSLCSKRQARLWRLPGVRLLRNDGSTLPEVGREPDSSAWGP